ncbi:hypothetical protein K7432_008807 [Basidiobolus ranarum]|uniref:Uncharacterized protein n=1 Tax=Basidiobolus ranarum TaxID=34480 RepID=A0ABR2WRA5_9FUNG
MVLIAYNLTGDFNRFYSNLTIFICVVVCFIVSYTNITQKGKVETCESVYSKTSDDNCSPKLISTGQRINGRNFNYEISSGSFEYTDTYRFKCAFSNGTISAYQAMTPGPDFKVQAIISCDSKNGTYYLEIVTSANRAADKVIRRYYEGTVIRSGFTTAECPQLGYVKGFEYSEYYTDVYQEDRNKVLYYTNSTLACRTPCDDVCTEFVNSIYAFIREDLDNLKVPDVVYFCKKCEKIWRPWNNILFDLVVANTSILGLTFGVTVFVLKYLFTKSINSDTLKSQVEGGNMSTII